MTKLNLDTERRAALWMYVQGEIERYAREVGKAPVAGRIEAAAVRAGLAAFDFERAVPELAAAAFAVRGMWEGQVHTPHPRYFGLFNPAPTAMGVAADALVGAFNPQMAAWSHNPFAAEVECHLIEVFGRRFGYREVDGVFTVGGAEANHTALLCALTSAFPAFARGGARALGAAPVIYVSEQSHHSVFKAARMCGLGTDCVRVLEVDGELRLRAATVEAEIVRDDAAGLRPLLLVATAGATSTGAMDPLPELAEVAARHGLWFHVDAAWGGLAAMVPELRAALEGIERADSITFDAHKSLSVPMGAGMFLTRHRAILEQAFRVSADYMPRAEEAVTDPYAHSMQWSRRFIGLKVFLSLAVAGWDGYAAALRHQVAMGELLRQEAVADGWRVANTTPLPLVCLQGAGPKGGDAAWIEAVAQAVVEGGRAWISAVRMPRGGSALRCCITNYRTQPEDVRALLAELRACAPPACEVGGAR